MRSSRLLLGRPSHAESVGLAPAQFVVIEADGSIEQVDSLKATFHGAADTGLNVARDSFDDALRLPQIAARQLGRDALCAKCHACPIWRVCGGGQYAHRYRPGTGSPTRGVLPGPAPAHRPRPLGDGGRHRGHPGPQAMSPRRHRIPADLLALLAEGGGGPAAIRRLAAIDLSRRMLLVSGVVTVSRQSGRAAHDLASQAYELLAAVQQEAPRAVDAVLRHPAVGAWAWRTVLAASSGRPSRLADPAGLALVAGAAAVRARFPCDLPVPVTDGAVMLPSLGQALVPPQTGDRLPRLRSRPDGATVLAGGARVPIPADPHRDAAGWHGLRAISATADGAAIRLVIDDLDPHRMPLPTLRGLARR